MSHQDERPWKPVETFPGRAPRMRIRPRTIGGEILFGRLARNLAGPEYWLYKKQRDE